MRPSSLLVPVLLMFAAPVALASGVASRTVVLDLTAGEGARDLVQWSPVDGMELHEDGLGRDGDLRTCVDGWVRTAELIAVGHPLWAPARVGVAVRIDRDRVRGETAGRPDLEPETVYARFGPDGVRWSNWQVLADATGPAAERWTHIGTLAAARPDRAEFEAALYADARAGGIDAEATLRRLVELDPRYLERAIPLIGYVQILHESSYYGGQRFRRIEVSLTWVVPGPVRPPAGPDDLWRYREACRVDGEGRLRIPSGADVDELDLGGTAVTDAGLASVVELPGLRRIDLSETAVTDAAIEHLIGLTLLREIDLRGTAVTEEGVRRLRGALTSLYPRQVRILR